MAGETGLEVATFNLAFLCEMNPVSRINCLIYIKDNGLVGAYLVVVFIVPISRRTLWLRLMRNVYGKTTTCLLNIVQ